MPLQRPITRYLEATGNTAPIKNVDLVARVQGFLQSINYKDGTSVKEGTTLFTIEPETYKLKLEQAQAAEAGAQASLKQAEADFKRQSESGAAAGRLAGDAGYVDLDARQRPGQSAAGPGQHQDRAVNYGYTNVAAPFDGIVTAHLVSVGELVGAASPTQLATIVQLDPIYVNFNVNEQDVLRVREEARRRGMTINDIRHLPIEVGAADRQPAFRTRASSTTSRRPSTSRPARSRCAAFCPIPTACCCLDFSSASAFPSNRQENALLVPDVALGSDQAGRYVLVVNGENVVEQRKVQTGPLDGESARDRERPEGR